MNTSKTKHLDTAIAILRGNPAAKRAPRKAQVEINVYVDSKGYMVQMNGRVLEQGTGDAVYATARAEARAESIRKLGKTVVISVY